MIKISDSVLLQAINQFGIEKQALVAVEEMSELQKELLKYFNRKEENRHLIKEELVDVLITLRQLFLIFNYSEKELNEMAERKLKRLETKLK
ncbi:MAG: hypothetical protein IJV75_00090 [Alphaproteobacteria bacterium]|nr:hypothetical protein [Alphaproteobacteria bacterium]